MPRGSQHPPRRPYRPTAPAGWSELFIPMGVGFLLGAAATIVFVLWRLK